MVVGACGDDDGPSDTGIDVLETDGSRLDVTVYPDGGDDAAMDDAAVDGAMDDGATDDGGATDGGPPIDCVDDEDCSELDTTACSDGDVVAIDGVCVADVCETTPSLLEDW